MYTLEIKLKQHTPLIHFNADEAGASLRLTELKPKLDKLLVEKLGGREAVFRNHLFKIKSYDASKEKQGYREKLDISLMYNVRFETTPEKEVSQISNKYPNFFANMGGVKEKKFSKLKSATNLIFKSIHPELIGLIEENIDSFLDKTNFGTRQSKGFGSFSRKTTSTLPFYFEIDLADYESFNIDKLVFQHIELFYKTLRSGINIINDSGDNTFYFKSLLFIYAKDPNNQWNKAIQWDKKTIKEELFLSQSSFNRKTERIDGGMSEQQKQFELDNNSPLFYKSNIKYLIRDLLGFSTSESWFSYKDTITKEDNEKVIERFKSPIIFKSFIDKASNLVTVFFGGVDTNSFTNKEIIIKSKSKLVSLSLITPEKFEVDKYLEYVIDLNLDISTHATRTIFDSATNRKTVLPLSSGDFDSIDEAKILKNIFKNLKKNTPSNP